MTTASSENRFRIEFNTYNQLNQSILAGNLPSLIVNEVNIPFKSSNIKVSGDTLEIDDITITFKLDENYENYNDLYDWLMNNYIYNNVTDKMIFDTIEYIILDARYKPIMSFTLGYIFPTNIAEIPHTTQSVGGDELEFTTTFKVNTITKNTSI